LNVFAENARQPNTNARERSRFVHNQAILILMTAKPG